MNTLLNDPYLLHHILSFNDYIDNAALSLSNKFINDNIRENSDYQKFIDFVNKHKSSNYSDLFTQSCKEGELKIAKTLYSLDNLSSSIDSISKKTLFVECCQNNQLESVKWLGEISDGYIDHITINQLFIGCCQKNYTEIVKWLYHNYHIDNKALSFAKFSTNNPHIDKWLSDLTKKRRNNH